MGKSDQPPSEESWDESSFRPIEPPTPSDPEKFPWTIEVALSGGGFRASAFSLGALLYLVDAGLNIHVSAISSVSGGSVTNGFIAARCDYSQIRRDEFTRIARELANNISHNGIWSNAYSRFYVSLIAFLGVSAFVVYFVERADNIYLLIAILVILAIVLSFRGLPITLWMAKTFFTVGGKKVCLGDLADRRTEHILCATDLVRARPFFFSTGNGGRIFFERDGLAPAAAVPMHIAVRASAAFPPLIPPIRFKTPQIWFRDAPLMKSDSSQPTKTVWLTDGGTFNNFGTDWAGFQGEVGIAEIMRHSGLLGSDQLVGKQGAGMPTPGLNKILLAIDASQPFATGRLLPFLLSIPILSFLAYVTRTMNVMYESTLVARTKHATDDAQLRMSSAQREWGLLGLDKVKDISELELLSNPDHLKGPLTLFVPLEAAPSEFARYIWRSYSEVSSAPHRETKYSLAQVYLHQLGIVRNNYGKLWPNEDRVATTFHNLGSNHTLRLMIHGYLNTREVLTSAFPLHWPPPIPDVSWFEGLLSDSRPTTQVTTST